MLQSMISISPLKIWQGEISNYPNIYLIAKAIAVLPYSSVQVERIFSAMKDIKNVKRNRLSIDNVEACLLGYQAFNNENIFLFFPFKTTNTIYLTSLCCPRTLALKSCKV